MITKILRDAITQIEHYETENPDEAEPIAPSFRALKFHIACVLQFIEQPTAEDLKYDPDGVDSGLIAKAG